MLYAIIIKVRITFTWRTSINYGNNIKFDSIDNASDNPCLDDNAI